MRLLLLVTACLLFLGLLNLPIGYYTFLRIAVTICAVLLIINYYKEELSVWVIIFGAIAILFNPIIPVYLNSKTAWSIIDFWCGILFLLAYFRHKTSDNR
jgi:hypothetical protein